MAPNGFMNGTAEEEEHAGEYASEDVYPDGPLQSGMQSLRRIKPKSKVCSTSWQELVVNLSRMI